MSIQEPDPYSGLSKPPVFSSSESDYTQSQVGKPLARVYYEEEDEHVPLLSKSVHGLEKEEDKKFRKRRWRSIYVMYFTMFLASLTFSVVISSIWPYLLQVDYSNASTKFLGWVVASYSFGQLIASPFFGVWGDIRPTREPLVAAFTINIIFNVLYSYLGAFRSGIAGWVMIASRILVGFGAGIGAVTRSYVSEATTSEERIGTMAAIGACQALGFIVGPVLGLAFVPLGSDGVEIPAIKFQLNMYTGPGFLSALLGIVNVILFVLFFKETRLIDRKAKKKQKAEEKRRKRELKEHQDTNVSDSVLLPAPKQQCFDVFAATASIVIFFIILSGFSVYETLLSPLTMDEFAWTRKQSVLYNNIFFAGLSFITITTLISVKYITKKVDERVVLMIGMFLLAFAFFVLIPMGSEPPKVLHIASLIDADPVGNVSNVSFSILTNANETLEEVGCRYPPQTWCIEIPRIYFAQLMVSLLIVTPGYASTSVTIFSIYSKVLGPVRQGMMMGLLTAAGSLARAVGPMGFSALYEHFGPYVTFGTIVGIFATTIMFILICSPRLIPYDRYTKKHKAVVKMDPA